MTMQSITVTYKGLTPLLQANPQTVSRNNKFARAMKVINAKKTRRTDVDFEELANLEIESSVYFDPSIGVYVPSSWVMESIASRSFAVSKISRERVRGAVFTVADKLPLNYRNKNKVKTMTDIVKNSEFRHAMILPQGQVRVEKNKPIFHDWSFSAEIEFDDTVIDIGDMKRIIEQAARYVGFGDFRPTFGRATVSFGE